MAERLAAENAAMAAAAQQEARTDALHRQVLRRDVVSVDSEIVAAQRMLAAQRHGVVAER